MKSLDSNQNKKYYYTFLLLFLVFYASWAYFLIGFRQDHAIFMLINIFFILGSKFTRQFTLYMVCFTAFMMTYDSMRLYPNYKFNEVATIELYNLEKNLFGIEHDAQIMTPNEYTNLHLNPVLDFATGIFYLLWIPLPLVFAIYLYFVDRIKLLEFSFTFLFLNLLGFVWYYIYPAAPPWYFEEYGTNMIYGMHGNAANFINFDKMINYPLFENMYNKNANVFASVPSLHAAYPVLVCYFAVKYKTKKFLIPSVIITLGIWGSAVYSFHHYIIDILLGIICVIFALVLFEGIINKVKFKLALAKYHRFIEDKFE